jgi:ABC-type lipoprotein export system ATPase subunit
MSTQAPHIVLTGVGKTFSTPVGTLEILRGVGATVHREEKIAIIGPSGSGKSTLLSLLAGLDKPTSGEILVDGASIGALDERALAHYRNKTIGIIFQAFELIVPFTVEENVSAPLDIARAKDPQRVADLIERVGLAHRRRAYPETLSGGERQRVAIARALVHGPSIVLADEPTGSLDRTTGHAVLDLLLEEVDREHTTLIIITHDQEIAKRMDRVFVLTDKQLIEQTED